MSERTSYLNAIELRDGQVLLFNRPNSKKSIWHMRLYVRGMEDIEGGKVKYYTRSTGELNVDEAKRVALDTHDRLRDKVRNSEPVFDSTFAEAYNQWWIRKKTIDLETRQAHKQQVEPIRDGLAYRKQWYVKHSQRYWIPYFGEQPLSKINNAVAEDYIRWRLTYWDRASKAEKKRHPNYAQRPSKKTLQMERTALREFFAWCVNTARLMRIVPSFDLNILQDNEESRRPSFNKAEWTKLDRYMRDVWVQGKAKGDEPDKGRPHTLHLFQREMCRRYIQFLTATGMRPTEPLFLKHRHIEIKRLDNGKEILKINLPQGKTGKREITSQPVGVQYYRAIIEATGKSDPDDWVFCDKEGKRSKGYYRTVEALLKKVGLRVDKETGKNRTSYSFRHYYAEQRISEAGLNLATTVDLRANMGTGIEQLERHYVRKKVYNAENLVSYRDRKTKKD